MTWLSMGYEMAILPQYLTFFFQMFPYFFVNIWLDLTIMLLECTVICYPNIMSYYGCSSQTHITHSKYTSVFCYKHTCLFFHSNSSPLTLLNQFCPKVLLDLHLSLSEWWPHLYLTHPLLALAPTELGWNLLLQSLPQQSALGYDFWGKFCIYLASILHKIWPWQCGDWLNDYIDAIWIVIKFTMPFTMVVTNGGITISLLVQILPTPRRSYSGMLRLSTVFLFEITVLRCTCFQVSPASSNSSSVIVTTKWCMTWVPILQRYPFSIVMIWNDLKKHVLIIPGGTWYQNISHSFEVKQTPQMEGSATQILIRTLWLE